MNTSLRPVSPLKYVLLLSTPLCGPVTAPNQPLQCPSGLQAFFLINLPKTTWLQLYSRPPFPCRHPILIARSHPEGYLCTCIFAYQLWHLSVSLRDVRAVCCFARLDTLRPNNNNNNMQSQRKSSSRPVCIV